MGRGGGNFLIRGYDWIDYNGVAFSKELLEWGRTFSDFWGRELFIFTVSKRTSICAVGEK